MTKIHMKQLVLMDKTQILKEINNLTNEDLDTDICIFYTCNNFCNVCKFLPESRRICRTADSSWMSGRGRGCPPCPAPAARPLAGAGRGRPSPSQPAPRPRQPHLHHPPCLHHHHPVTAADSAQAVGNHEGATATLQLIQGLTHGGSVRSQSPGHWWPHPAPAPR